MLRNYAARTVHTAKDLDSSSWKLTENNGSANSTLDKEAEWHERPINQNQQNTNIVACPEPPCAEESFQELYQQPFSYGKMGSVEQTSHFKKLQSFKADYTDANFTQYESQRTGMRAVVVDRKGPKVRFASRKPRTLLT